MMLLRILILFCICNIAFGCNRIYCASKVSNCVIGPSCEDDKFNEERCRTNFANCMGNFYLDCCDCIDMCPDGRRKRSLPALTKSSFAILDGAPKRMFTELTDGPDDFWESLRFPIDYDIKKRKPKLDVQCTYHLTSELIL